MSEIDERLDRAAALLDRAGNDADLLGVVLLSLHDALAKHIDATFNRRRDLSLEERQLLEETELGWPARISMAGRYGVLTEAQCNEAKAATRARNEFAHGAPIGWSRANIQRYSAFVHEVCGHDSARPRSISVTVEPSPSAARMAPASTSASTASRTTSTASATAAAQAWSERIEQRRSRSPQLINGPLGWAAIALAALLIVFGGWWALTRTTPPISRVMAPAQNLVQTPTLPPTPAPSPTPTIPTVRMAQLKDLPASGGTLRATPDFNGPPLPGAIVNGMRVEVIGPQQLDAGQIPWIPIRVNGQDGWQPANNIEFLP